jgi:uncharacterized membrane protein
MHKGRLEAFSDGVIAILITIMVLELKVPHGSDFSTLQPLIPIFISYILSFIYIGIYWNNHHHLMQAAQKVNGASLWANLHLLFWLSMIPFATSWMGENHFATEPVALYGAVLFCCGGAYTIFAKILVHLHGKDSKLAKALGPDTKGNLSVLLYIIGIALSFVHAWIAVGIYIVVAIMWLIPDRRIERVLHDHENV